LGVTQLVRREAAPHACRGRGTPQVGRAAALDQCRPRVAPLNDAEQRTDRELAPQLDPGLKLFPSPRVHADLASAPALAAPDERRAAALIEIGFGQRQRLLDTQSGPPQDDDQTAQPCARSPAAHMTATISSTFGGSAGYRRPLLPGAWPAWNPGSVAAGSAVWAPA
jgi:hypothetical protein